MANKRQVKKVRRWYDAANNINYREGDIIKVYDEEKPQGGLDENYRIIKIDLDNEIMECVQVGDNGEDIGFYQFPFGWVMTPQLARVTYPEYFPIGEETKAGIDAFLTEYEKCVRENTCGNCHNRLTQEDAVDLLAKAVGLLREVTAA